MVVLTIGGMLGLMVGFLYWVTVQGLEGFVQVWSIFFLMFIIILIVAFYVGGYSRIKQAKQVILEAQK
jgi:hypothetical protein